MTLSVELPEQLIARLQAEAVRRGVTVDTLIAEFVDRLPADASAGETRIRRLSFAGTLEAEPDFAERSEELLDDTIRRTAG